MFIQNEKISISIDSFNFIGYSLYASNKKYDNNKIVFNKNQIISNDEKIKDMVIILILLLILY